MTRADRLRQVLTDALQPLALEVVDDSARHAGHAGVQAGGAQAGGETHYNVLIVSERFAGLSRVNRSREVHALLAGEFGAGLHALGLTLKAPGEA